VGAAAIVQCRTTHQCSQRKLAEYYIGTGDGGPALHQCTRNQIMFLSESLSFLQYLQIRDLSHPIIAEILRRVHGILSIGASVDVGS